MALVHHLLPTPLSHLCRSFFAILPNGSNEARPPPLNPVLRGHLRGHTRLGAALLRKENQGVTKWCECANSFTCGLLFQRRRSAPERNSTPGYRRKSYCRALWFQVIFPLPLAYWPCRCREQAGRSLSGAACKEPCRRLNRSLTRQQWLA